MAKTPNISIMLLPHCTPSARNFRARVPLLYTSLKNPVVSGAHCGRRLFWENSFSWCLLEIFALVYSFCTCRLKIPAHSRTLSKFSSKVLGFFSQLETTLSTPLSAVSIHSKFLSYSGVTDSLSRVSNKEKCSVWILGINPRMTFKVYQKMTENRVFCSASNFSKKWQKPCVEALKRSEIECLGFTERERDLC